jgi:hypothetical protein
VITPFPIGIEVSIQVIGKEKQFENGEHYKKLHQNDEP